MSDPQQEQRHTRMFVCKRCSAENDYSHNGYCAVCWKIEDAAWRAKMAIRLDASAFNVQKLVNLLLSSHWMHECEIIPEYMPPNPFPDTQPRCVVKCSREGLDPVYLRHSCGPLQGYSWDVYGDDMLYPELALIALSQSQPPYGINAVPTHGK